MVRDYRIIDVLDGVFGRRNYIPFLIEFLQLQTPTTRAFVEKLLPAAIAEQQLELIRALLKLGVNLTDFKPCPECIIKIKDDILVNQLLVELVGSTYLSGDVGGKLLYEIADTSRFDIARFLISKRANINFCGRDGTALHQAIGRQYFEMVKFLVDNGADVNKREDQYSRTPLSLAVYRHNYEIIEYLLKNGANPTLSYDLDRLDWGEVSGSTLDKAASHSTDLHQFIRQHMDLQFHPYITTRDIIDAALKGEKEFSEYTRRGKLSDRRLEEALLYSVYNRYESEAALALLDYGVDPDVPSLLQPRYLPIESAIIHQDAEMVRALIHASASTDVPTLLGKSLEYIEDTEIFDILIESGVDIEEQGPYAIQCAMELDSVEFVEMLIDKGSPFDDFGYRMSPLQEAADMGKFDFVKLFLDRGADVNKPAHCGGYTALQAACLKNKRKIINLLLEHGADVNAPPGEKDGITALQAVLQADLSRGVFHSDTSKRRRRQNKQKDLFRLLLRRGGDPSKCIGNSTPVLHQLLENSYFNLLEEVLKTGIQPDQMKRGENGRTPLQLAAKEGMIDAVKLLVEHGAKVNYKPAYKFGRTALQAAASRQIPSIPLLEYLLKQGAKVNARAGLRGGITAIQGAAISGCIPVARLLLDNGADVNGAPSPRDGRTAVEGAAEHGRLDMVQFLLNHGAKGDALRGGTGYGTAIELAKKEGHMEIVKILQAADESEV